jgi:hypothetical protein
MSQNVAVHGVEQNTTETGPYGDSDPYEAHLVVEIGGEEEFVPVTGVRKAAFDYRGDVPDAVDFDRVTLDGDSVHAETHLSDGSVVELYREGVHGTWTMERFEDSADPGFVEVWSRPGSEEREVTDLVNQGLSPAEALDFWMVEMHDARANAWAEERGTSHQAVSENVRKAREKLGR